MQVNGKSIQDYIGEHLDLISADAKSMAAAQDRAATFLVAAAHVSLYLMELEKSMTKAKTLTEIQFSNAIGTAEGKNITERKANAPKCVAYTTERERLECADAQRKWLATTIKIFENAHTFFRQLSNR